MKAFGNCHVYSIEYASPPPLENIFVVYNKKPMIVK